MLRPLNSAVVRLLAKPQQGVTLQIAVRTSQQLLS